MQSYHNAISANNIGLPKFGSAAQSEPELTKGGRIVKRHRPLWSASLCNAVAGLAGIGQEVRHHVG